MNTADWEKTPASVHRSIWVYTSAPRDRNYARIAPDWPLARTTGDVRKDASRAPRLCSRLGRFVVRPLSCRGPAYSFLKAWPPRDESMRKIWTPTKRNIHVIGCGETRLSRLRAAVVLRQNVARPAGPDCQAEFHGQLAAARPALRYVPEFGRARIVLPTTVIVLL